MGQTKSTMGGQQFKLGDKHVGVHQATFPTFVCVLNFFTIDRLKEVCLCSMKTVEIKTIIS